MILIFEFVSFDVDPLVGVAVDQFVPTFDVAGMPRRTFEWPSYQLSFLGTLFEALHIEQTLNAKSILSAAIQVGSQLQNFLYIRVDVGICS